jgi:beta-lactam-binding protein with PASTA domain
MTRNRFVPTVLAVALLLAGCDSTAATTAAPDVVGMRLPEARQTLQDKGYEVAVTLPTGDADREIIEPANWVVEVQWPKPGTEVRPDERFTLTVAKPTDATTPAEPTKGVVPKVVCLDLQAAQEALRAAGFYYLTSSDATGQGRQQVLDRNWVVVAQSSAPGSSPEKTTKIDLSTVKLGEPTGDSGCPS